MRGVFRLGSSTPEWSHKTLVAEVHGNRTRPAECPGRFGFEDREDHQVPAHLRIGL